VLSPQSLGASRRSIVGPFSSLREMLLNGGFRVGLPTRVRLNDFELNKLGDIMRRLSTLLGGVAALLLATNMAAAAQTSDQAEPRTKAKRERLICQTMQETGSLARQRRQCFTRAEWDRIAEAARARGQRLMSDMASGMTSN
jgi:hypothetical protein